ncbi:DUF5060 domain-containing protein [candidate division KSB1 bacterium]|nr:DUF5060 domain-containing protein [candidate division KSB1 bacterium]RQW07937.1 MAG: DUF5060 domain-containing protein [candidate division KSB1 bacterium]
MRLITFLLLFVAPVLFSQGQPWDARTPIVQWSSDDTVSVQKWDVLEITLRGPKGGNPFRDVQFSAAFTHQKTTIVNGFYDGRGVYKIRFMPQSEGIWRFETTSDEKNLDGVVGHFFCVAPDSLNHGPVDVHDTFHFAYRDGTLFWPVGTTLYAWAHQPEEKIRETLQSLAAAPFNKVRMKVFPMHYIYNRNEPDYYPFPRNRKGENDFSEFNVEFYQHFEQCILNLQSLGIQADVILFDPYDRWGYAEMTREQDDFYLQYTVARLAAFRNVWWTIGNEYDLMLTKSPEDWDRFFRIVYENDPYGHLRSILNGNRFYDHSLPWVTHVTVQSTDFSRLRGWLEMYQKPVIYEMVHYEGNLIPSWGRISAEEMVNRIWKGVVRGGYVTHGETIKDPNHEWIWWSTGGPLLGASPERIAFLKEILQEAPSGLRYMDEHVGGIAGEYYLYYFGEQKVTSWAFELPGYREYSVDIIDAWNMTTTPLDTAYGEAFSLDLPGRPYTAIRIRKNRLVFPEEPVQIVSNGNLFLNRMVVQLQHRHHEAIYYTLDGTPPTRQADRYASPIIMEGDTTVLKAISYGHDGRPSKMVSRTFFKANPLPAHQLDKVKNGIQYQFYFGLWEVLPDFTDLRAGTAGTAKNISLDVREQNDAFGLVFAGYIAVPLTDVYTFTTLSDDGSKVYLDDQLVVNNDGQHMPQRQSGQIGLQAGYHKIRVEFFEAGGGEELKVYWACSVIDEEEIPAKALFLEK